MTRAVLGLLMAMPLIGACGPRVAGELPYYGTADFTPNWRGSFHRVGAFSLLTQDGATITDRDLAGRVHIASFIYTRCSALCPVLVGNLKKVQDAIHDRETVIVSYTVTPDLDPPAVLAAFGRDHGIDPARWKLVTGDKSEIYRLARESYFASDERLRETAAGPDAFLHTEKIVLVDGQGRLRGVYNGTQPFEIDHLIEDTRALRP